MDQHVEQEDHLRRREFLRRAAVTGAVVWAVPTIDTIVAKPAFAGTSPQGDCSTCNGACNAAGPQQKGANGNGGNACLALCKALCPSDHGNGCAGGICCNTDAFSSANFCSPPDGIACYFGTLGGSCVPTYNTVCASSGRPAVCYDKQGNLTTTTCC